MPTPRGAWKSESHNRGGSFADEDKGESKTGSATGAGLDFPFP